MKTRDPSTPLTDNKPLLKWVDKMFSLCQPDNIHWCDGSQGEYDELCDLMVRNGSFVKLDE